MDYLTFISNIISTVAWPAAVLAFLFFFRKEVQALVPLIRRVKAGPLELELEEIKREVDEAKALAAAAEAKADDLTEKFDEGEVENTPRQESEKATAPVSNIEAKVLNTMAQSRFLLRSISGVAKETALSKITIQTTYKSLVSKGLLEETQNKEGQARWKLTKLGKAVARESQLSVETDPAASGDLSG